MQTSRKTAIAAAMLALVAATSGCAGPTGHTASADGNSGTGGARSGTVSQGNNARGRSATPDMPSPDATPGTPSPDATPGTPSPDATPGTPSPDATPGTPSPDATPGTPSPDATPGTPSPDATPGTPSPENSTATEPATNNQVILGVSFGPLSVYFGPVLPGGSAVRQFSITNNSAQPITVIAITTDSMEFSATTNCNGSVLQADDSCIFYITFQPLEEGTYDADLSITVSPSSIPVTAPSLEGSAGPPLTQGPAVNPPQSQVAPGDDPASPAGTPTPSAQSSLCKIMACRALGIPLLEQARKTAATAAGPGWSQVTHTAPTSWL